MLRVFDRHDRLFDKVNIVLVGKYTSLKDSYMSVIKSLEHAALRCQRKLILEVRCVITAPILRSTDEQSALNSGWIQRIWSLQHSSVALGSFMAPGKLYAQLRERARLA